MFTIKIAEIAIGIENRYSYMESYSKDYIIADATPEFTVSASDEEIAYEQSISPHKLPPDYVETIVIYRKIAEILPQYDALVFHGAVIEYNGEAYAITAHSGVGKTTHIRLWLEEFGEAVKILNGDKPILRIIDGCVYACGTPWRGKENYGINSMRPLRAIAFLGREKVNLSKKIESRDAVMRFMNQIYINRKSASALSETMRLADRILESVNLYDLKCNMDREAARVAHRAFTENITTEV